MLVVKKLQSINFVSYFFISKELTFLQNTIDKRRYLYYHIDNKNETEGEINMFTRERYLNGGSVENTEEVNGEVENVEITYEMLNEARRQGKKQRI